MCPAVLLAASACTSPYSLQVVYDLSTDPPTNIQHASVTFGSATSMDYMSKNIMLSGEAGISKFSNTVQVGSGGGGGGNPVPEPGSTVLIGFGLIAASLVLRKKIRRDV